MAEDESKRATQASPSWGQMSAQDRVWNTLDVVKSCAAQHGEMVVTLVFKPECTMFAS